MKSKLPIFPTIMQLQTLNSNTGRIAHCNQHDANANIQSPGWNSVDSLYHKHNQVNIHHFDIDYYEQTAT